MIRFTSSLALILALGVFSVRGTAADDRTALSGERHPRPSVAMDPDRPRVAPGITFMHGYEDVGIYVDVSASFPRRDGPDFKVTRVEVNGAETKDFLVFGDGVVNQHRLVYGSQDLAVMTYAAWEPGQVYQMVVAGVDAKDGEVRLEAKATAPAQRMAVKLSSLGAPSAAYPYHYVSLTLAKEAIEAGKVAGVEVDGRPARDVRVFHTGPQDPHKAKSSKTGPGGESYEKIIDGTRDVQIIAPCTWTNGSQHVIRVVIKQDSGKESVYEQKVAAPGSGGHWDPAWPYAVSVTLRETAGLVRQGEPVHLCLGLFSDEITDPQREIRVVTYSPHHPQADSKGYVVAPCQLIESKVWRDEALLNKEELDAETHERVHRYDATTTVELVFLADVAAYEERVYQVLYGNPKAEPLAPATDLKLTQKQGLAQTVENAHYRFELAANSGAIETVTVLGSGEPMLLEHKLETNGAVHWNPDAYAPPKPWVHVSDWEKAEFRQITGPVMHRTRRFGPMPFLDDVLAHVSYAFYAGQPYLLSNSLTHVRKETFVQALRNAEIVFNHATLNEFVWLDPLGAVKNLDLTTARKHPEHAVKIAPSTAWMAFISREKKVGFAGISLGYENINVFGDLPGEAQPFIYVQNGPWIYWSRGLVYPFGGSNLTQMMPVREGSAYLERWAYLPFRLGDENAPFAAVERVRKQLKQPLLVQEWQPTNARTPEKWVSPILTAPFNEGVKDAVSSQKDLQKK